MDGSLYPFCLSWESPSVAVLPPGIVVVLFHTRSDERPLLPTFHISLRWAENTPAHLIDDRMWYSSTHIQGHRGRIGSTRTASPSTALAPPSLACPLPPAGFAIAPCKHHRKLSLLPIPHIPALPNTSI